MNTFDLQQLYKTVFGVVPYNIARKGSANPVSPSVSFGELEPAVRRSHQIDYTLKQIALNKQGVYGLNIWHPIEFWKSNTVAISLDCCTIGVTLNKTIIRTAVSERKGTVKEQFNTDDYRFSIRGFLIGKDQFFPEDQITTLKELHETTEPVSLHGGYPEIFLDESCRVVIVTLDFPEVQGKSPWIRPFSMTCESDFIQDLIIP